VEGFGRGLIYLNLAAVVVLLLRLFTLGLFRIYRSLFFYLLTYTLQFVATAVFPIRSTAYSYSYMVGESANLALSMMVVLELYKFSLAGQPALAGFGRKTVGYALALAAVVAAGGVMLDAGIPPGESRFRHYFFTAERTMDFTILMFLLFITAFMMWFPVKIRRNIVFYIGGFAVFYFSRTFGLLMINVLPAVWLKLITNFLMACSVGCLLAWLFGLRRETEDFTTIVGHRWNPAAAKRLTAQLDAINVTLAHLGDARHDK